MEVTISSLKSLNPEQYPKFLISVRWQDPKKCEPGGFGPMRRWIVRKKSHPVGFLGSFSLLLSFSAKRKERSTNKNLNV